VADTRPGRLDIGRVEVVDRDDARRQFLEFTKLGGLVLRQHVLLDRLLEPVEAVVAAHRAGTDRTVELAFGFLGGHRLLEGDLEDAFLSFYEDDDAA